MAEILLDSNILIPAFENENSDEAEKLRELMADKNVAIFITPLISYEVLRVIAWINRDKYEKVKESLSMIPFIDINHKITYLASELFRLEKHIREDNKQQSKKIDKHNLT